MATAAGLDSVILRWPVLARAVAVGLLYFMIARLSLGLTVQPAGIAAVWPPSGLLFAILALTPPRTWPPMLAAVFVSITVANLSASNSLAVSLAFAAANCAESALAAFTFTRVTQPPLALTSLRQLGLLLLIAVVVSNAATALLGATVAAVAFGAPFWEAWRLWWIADGLGMLLVGATILTWASGDDEYSPRSPASAAEAVLAFALLIVVSSLTFGAPPERIFSPAPYLTFPLMLWVAMRFGPRGAAPAAVTLAVIAVWFTVEGRGPFAAATADPAVRVLEVQAFLLVEGISTLALAALTAERRRAGVALRRANDELEARVAERTAALIETNARLISEIGERTQAEVALRESQQRMRQALRVARSFTFEWNPASDRVIRSADCGEILGLEGDAALYDTGTSFFARIHPDDHGLLRTTIGGLTPASDTYSLIYRVARPDGGVVTLEETARAIFDENGRLMRLFGISADVTARQRAAMRTARMQAVTAALSAARTPEQVAAVVVEQGVAALEASAGTIIVLDTASDDLVLIAAAGYGQDVVRPWTRFPRNAVVPTAEVVRTGAPVWIESREELLACYPDLAGTPVRNRSFVALPLAVDGRVLGALGLSFQQPQTFGEEDKGYMSTLANLCAQALDRARLYVAEQDARSAAEAAVQLRDQFLSIASHELKTPLTVLLGNALLLQRRADKTGDLSERYQRGLRAIAEQAVRLDRLIGMLLDVSRLDRGQLTLDLVPIDLGVLLRRLIDELQPTLIHHTVELTMPDVPAVVLGDELRLEQLLQNLIYNAVKYSPDGGTVEVRLRLGEGSAQISVADQGIGIPAAELSQLFGRFFRASNTADYQIGGLGIGLYVAREIVERHGGTISVASEPGSGSTFTVQLPLAPRM